MKTYRAIVSGRILHIMAYDKDIAYDIIFKNFGREPVLLKQL